MIREERGLAYSVYSGLSCFRDTGQLTVYAGTDPKNVPEVLELVMVELGRIRTSPSRLPSSSEPKITCVEVC